MGKGGGEFLGELINGHPVEAITGNHSSFAQALDGQPAAALGFGGDKTSGGSPAPAAIPRMGPATVPSANGFMPATPKLNNIAQSPMANNPLVTQPNAPIAAAQAPNNSAQQPIMAQIQHPEFQNFIASVMQNVGQSTQPGVS